MLETCCKPWPIHFLQQTLVNAAKCNKTLCFLLDILACWRWTRTKSGKYGPRALWSQFYMSLGSLYVPREVDLADKTRGAQRPESCPPGQPLEGHIGSLGTYRIVTRVPLGRILSTGRALWARPVRQGFCPRPPPAGQYVLYAPLTVYRISGMYNVQWKCTITISMTIQHFNTITGFACISIRPLGCTGCPCVYRIAQGTYRLYMSLGPYRIFMHLYVPRAI